MLTSILYSPRAENSLKTTKKIALNDIFPSNENQKIKENDILKETKFAEHKLQTSDIIIKMGNVGFVKDSEKVKECGNFLEFALKENLLTKERKEKLANANFCKNRFCPMCNWRRTRNITGQLKEAFDVIQKKESISTLFLTLTIKNPDVKDLKKAVTKMNYAFKRMSETKRFKGSILGYFKGLEILGDKTPKGQAHPHFHIMLIVNSKYFKDERYISKDEWISMWQKALKVSYRPNIDIRRIKSKNKDMSDIDSAILETAKYAVKHTELAKRTNEDFYYLYTQTANMRFYATGGILKEYINLIKIDEDLINLKAETEAFWIEICRLIYTWQNGDYRLKDIKPPKIKELENG